MFNSLLIFPLLPFGHPLPQAGEVVTNGSPLPLAALRDAASQLLRANGGRG